MYHTLNPITVIMTLLGLIAWVILSITAATYIIPTAIPRLIALYIGT